MIRSCVLYDEYLQNRKKFNTYHVHELDPYIVDENDKVIIDKKWFDSLTKFIQIGY